VQTYAGMLLHQPSGVYLTLHRAYDPYSGRWLSRDPAGELIGGINLYAYVEGKPTYEIDRYGLCGCGGANPNGPGAVAGVSAAFGGAVGVSVTGAGDVYVSAGFGWPGVGGSVIVTSSMSGYAGGWSGQVNAGGAVGGNPGAYGAGAATPGEPSASYTYGWDLGNICNGANDINNSIANDLGGGANFMAD